MPPGPGATPGPGPGSPGPAAAAGAAAGLAAGGLGAGPSGAGATAAGPVPPAGVPPEAAPAAGTHPPDPRAVDPQKAQAVLEELLQLDREFSAQEGKFMVAAQPARQAAAHARIASEGFTRSGSFRADDMGLLESARNMLRSGQSVIMMADPQDPRYFILWKRMP